MCTAFDLTAVCAIVAAHPKKNRVLPRGPFMSDATTTIYEPPTEGLPYLVVTFASDGMNVSTAKSSAAARTMASDRSITHRRRRLTEQSKVSPKPTTPQADGGGTAANGSASEA